MEPFELLRRVATALDGLNVRYFVTGSMATIYYGRPRLTNDIDIVVDLPLDRIAALIRAFDPSEFYVDEQGVRDAVAAHGQFNIIHPESGFKIDLMIPARDEFNASRFGRRRRLEIGEGSLVPFAAPEDVILRKLEYYAAGGSDKHLSEQRRCDQTVRRRNRPQLSS